MENEIGIGEEVLDYISELMMIQEELQEAELYAISCKSNVMGAEGYQGEAKEELELFFNSLESHLQRMIFLYQASSSYIKNAYQTLWYNEEQVMDWIVNQIGGGKKA